MVKSSICELSKRIPEKFILLRIAKPYADPFADGQITFFQVVSLWTYMSIANAGLVAGGKGDNHREHTCIFTAVNSLCEIDVDHQHDSGRPRMLPIEME